MQSYHDQDEHQMEASEVPAVINKAIRYVKASSLTERTGLLWANELEV